MCSCRRKTAHCRQLPLSYCKVPAAGALISIMIRFSWAFMCFLKMKRAGTGQPLLDNN